MLRRRSSWLLFRFLIGFSFIAMAAQRASSRPRLQSEDGRPLELRGELGELRLSNGRGGRWLAAATLWHEPRPRYSCCWAMACAAVVGQGQET